MKKIDQNLTQLFILRNRFGQTFAKEKKWLLLELSEQNKFTSSAFKKYVDLLLFLLAYPENKELYSNSLTELTRITSLLSKQNKLANQLYQFGISHTTVSGKFSFELIRWLNSIYKKNLGMDPLEVEETKIISVLSLLMPDICSEILLEGQVKWKTWMMGFSASKNESLLEILIRFFEASNLSPKLKEQLWSDLDIYINLDLTPSIPNRSSQVAIKFPVFFHKEIKKQFSPAAILNQKVQEIFLKDADKKALIKNSRMALVCYQRETDPITFASEKYCHYYQLSNGVSLALFGLPPEKRQAIDCYIGYLAYKNGLPIAYGGGWIFVDSCRIGINIFPAYRGGESALLFMQILSAYKNIFRLNRFTVDPYQIGKNNSEGIQSGAFWMYYRLGFKPIQEEYKNIAASEFNLLLQTNNYRTSIPILKKLANSTLEFCFDPKKQNLRLDATDLSCIAQRNFIKNKLLRDKSITRISDKQEEKTNLKLHWEKSRFAENWFLLLEWDKLDSSKKKKLLPHLKKIISLKINGDEWSYIRLLQNERSLVDEIKY